MAAKSEAKMVKCGRCGGSGECCPCCSGFAIDHPELFGGASGRLVKCPDCNGKGKITATKFKALPEWKLARFYQSKESK